MCILFSLGVFLFLDIESASILSDFFTGEPDALLEILVEATAYIME